MEDFEQKYNELVEAVRAVVEGNPGLCNIDEGLGRLRKLLPEKESEAERIRKMIENTLRDAVISERISETSYREMSAYLEKQKEPITPEEKMNHPLYLEGFDVGKKVGEALKEQKPVNFYVPEGIDMNDPKSKIAVILGIYSEQTGMPQEEYLSLLKFLGEQHPANSEEPKEWSEEDKTIIDCAVEVVEKAGLPSLAASLKSLRPQPHWKPSEEQMKILQYVCEDSSHPNQDVIPTLESLYNDLKKLI